LIGAVTSTWRELYTDTAQRLDCEPEARWLVEEVAGTTWQKVIFSDGAAPEKARLRLSAMIDRRMAGEPLQYVLGRWAFRGLDLMVDQRVLIPRPETEYLVEVALAELDRLTVGAAIGPEFTVVDLGTGSGAIALSVVAERTGVRMWATDQSAQALEVARVNLAGLAGSAATRVCLSHGSWWSALPSHLEGRIDLVVSNPPYVASDEMGGLEQVVVGWEPRTALEAGPTGLEAVEEILSSGPAWLTPSGVTLLEIAPHQAVTATRSALSAGFAEVEVRPDLAGRDRVLIARMERAERGPHEPPSTESRRDRAR